jgi:hypothetical protein
MNTSFGNAAVGIVVSGVFTLDRTGTNLFAHAHALSSAYGCAFHAMSTWYATDEHFAPYGIADARL